MPDPTTVTYAQMGPRALVRQDSIRALSKTSFLVFDFDGVLISVSQSYREAVRESVHYLFAEILGLETPASLVTAEDVQEFKDAELFNNDWTLTYALILYFLSLTLLQLKKGPSMERFAQVFSRSDGLQQLVRALAALGEEMNVHDVRPEARWKVDPAYGLDGFLERIRARGKDGMKEAILDSISWLGDDERALLRRMAPYGDEIDLVKRLFEEIYLGGQLFTRFYRQDPVFIKGPGYIENEKLIPMMKTLDLLGRRFGKFGIYSERPREQGLYALGLHGIAQFFLPEMTIFQEDIEASANDSSDFGKPNPEALVRLLKARPTSEYFAYVGDTVADAALVDKAKRSGFDKLLFIGTYGSSTNSGNLVSKYRGFGADAIVEDVNSLPEVVMIEPS